MSRALFLVFAVPAVVVAACSGNTPLPVAEDGSSSTGGGCTGTAPSCFGNDLSNCCGQDPSGTATCKSGRWMCGAAGAPGCNGTSCLGGGGGCIGTAPSCFGNDTSKCCGQDPSGPATCAGGRWTCGTAAAPGCNGTSCLSAADGGTGCVPACDGTQVCVSEQTVGGGQPFPDDAGNCPIGTVHAGDRCAPPPTYSCAPYPAACGAALDCGCAASLCTGNYVCIGTSSGQVSCQFGAP